jgi:hypothetical protein
MDFLIERFTFVGVEFQIWMPIVVGALAAYLVFVLKTGGMH